MELGISDLKISRTWPHFRRMHTTRLPTICVSVATTEVVGPQVKKFEQVSSDDHQTSVARGGRYLGPLSGGRWVGTQIPCQGEGG